MPVICTHCSTEQPDGGKFCGACGSQIGFHCRYCGAVNPDWFAFCSACGLTLDVSAGAPPATRASAPPSLAHVPATAAPPATTAGLADDLEEHQRVEHETWERLGLAEGERRRVTVLFADVSGFTAMSEKKDPEEMNVIMHEVMTDLATIIRGYDGHVEKFIGDAICAIFGAPISHEDEPERACLAALEMHGSVAAWSARHPDLPTLAMHIGINTGMVVAGTTGDGSQFGVTGDTINTAARLEGKAIHGQTFVSPETARRVRHQFLLEDMGAFEFKGKEKAVPVFNVLRELTPEEQQETKILRAPLIGRADEMNMLLSSARRASRTQEGGATVLLVGEAGTGKSRLLEEVADAVAKDMRVLRAAARVHGGRTFGVLADALGPVIDELPDGDTKQTVRSLFGEGSAPLSELQRTLAGMIAWAADHHPVAILIDNLEYADESSIDVLRFLTNATADCDVLWVLACRLGGTAFDAVSIEGPSVTRMRLRNLSHDDTAKLFEALLPGALDEELRNQLADRAEGNPEFAEAIAMSFVDEDVVVPADDGWKLVGDPDLVEIPGTLQELIEARIDALSDHARVTLQDAAVVGLSFTPELLAMVSSVRERLDAALAELVEAELVRPPSLLNTSGSYVFKSPLVREVAYSSILLRRRPEYHRRVGEALLTLNLDTDEEVAELLAHHFEEGEDVPRAVHYLGVASARAQQAYAFRSAQSLTDRALALRKRFPDAVGPDKAATLLERRAICNMIDNDHEHMLTDLIEASELWDTLSQPHHHGRVMDMLAWFLALAYRLDDAVEHIEQAVALADAHELESVKAGVAVTLQLIMAFRGEPARALEEMPGVVAAAERCDDPAVAVRARIVWGAIEHWEGNSAVAAERLRYARDEALEGRFPISYALATWWLVLAEMEIGHYREALDLAQTLRAHAEEAGDRIALVRVHSALGAMFHEIGDLTRSSEHSHRSITLSDHAGAPDEERVPAVITMAEVALDRGEIDEAIRRLEGVLDAVETEDWMAWRFGSRHDFVRGRAALQAGDVQGALAAAGRMRSRLTGSSSKKDLLRADWLEGEARIRDGDHRGAVLLERAVTTADVLGSPYLNAEVNLAVARSLPERAPEAIEVVQRSLKEMAEHVPADYTAGITDGPLARELDRIR
jgi:class 3 adenylate cyclase/tetratricopeptide (TPR) repeat protein